MLSCVQLCDPMDCSLPGFSVHWILWARILEWVTILFSRGSPINTLYIYIYIWMDVLAAQKSCLQCRRPGFNPQVGKIPWRVSWKNLKMNIMYFNRLLVRKTWRPGPNSRYGYSLMALVKILTSQGSIVLSNKAWYHPTLNFCLMEFNDYCSSHQLWDSFPDLVQ